MVYAMKGEAPMGGGGPDPYDDILAVCQKLSAIQPVTVEPLPLQVVQLGTYDAMANTFTWDPNIHTETHTETTIEPPGDGILHPHPVTTTITTYSFKSMAVTVVLQVSIVNNPTNDPHGQNVTFYIGSPGGTPQPAAVVPPGTPIVSAEGPFSGDVQFILIAANRTTGPGGTVHADRSGFSDFRGSVQQPGCVVVPALPVAIAYQPPTTSGRGEFNSTQSTGATITTTVALLGEDGGLSPSRKCNGVERTSQTSAGMKRIRKPPG